MPVISLDGCAPWERDEYAAVLDGALAVGGGRPTAAAVEAAEQGVGAAEAAGRVWAGWVRSRLVREALRLALKERAKAENVVVVAFNGATVTRSLRMGARRRRRDGSTYWDQPLLHEMTWDELLGHLRLLEAQVGALLVNESVARRLLALRADHPGSRGPAEACAAMGLSVAEFLGRPEAAS